MPKINDQNVIAVLKNHYFDHHTAMHLARERVEVFDPETQRMVEVPPIANSDHHCTDCPDMIEAGNPGSGRQFLEMHHDMLRVFRYLLQKEGLDLGVEWEPEKRQWVAKGPNGSYTPVLWDLDQPTKLPEDIRSLFGQFDADFLDAVYRGVKARRDGPKGNRNADPIDELGRFIERGVKKGEEPDGRGFHNTIHDYLGARERKSAWGAEMNRLANSRFNDYFWSLHLWINAQYGRTLENLGQPFDWSAQPPEEPARSMVHQAGAAMTAGGSKQRVARMSHMRAGTLPKTKSHGG